MLRTRWRASDAEREAVVAHLHAAVGEGRLTADETGPGTAPRPQIEVFRHGSYQLSHFQ